MGEADINFPGISGLRCKVDFHGAAIPVNDNEVSM
jgi:hypothetical protein